MIKVRYTFGLRRAMSSRPPSEYVTECPLVLLERFVNNLEGMWDDENNGVKYFAAVRRFEKANRLCLNSKALIRFDGFRLTWGRSYGVATTLSS